MSATSRGQVTRPRLVRRSDGKVIAGVAAGVADFLGIDRSLVRVAFVVLAIVSGLGVVLYAVAWVLLPNDDGAGGVARAPTEGGWDWVQAAALGAVVLGVVLLLEPLGVWFPEELAIPAALGAGGVALLLGRNRADPAVREGAGRSELLATVVGRGRGALARVVIGAVLVVSGIGAFLATSDAFDAVRQGVVATLVIAGGLGLIFGPWLWRLAGALSDERRERIRSEERAEMAAHLHDSVLQTLAMIQRQADEPRTVTTLARRQERELRGWLFDRVPPAAGDDLGAALEGAAAEVEGQHGVAVEVVRVGGDCPLDDRLRVLVLACREALVNAARHSGVPTVSLYLEVEPERATVFVRDRGAGFEREAIASDRRGITESIEGRMRRAGGKAVIRSRPATGTEVELTMPRVAP
jgi:signal transduction histidine kinase/phage shock protein PspC (stress-responsive transcriptional regulator)